MSEEDTELDEIILSDRELEYRRGFSHGFAAACRSPETSMDDVMYWVRSRELVGAPGTCLHKQPMHGLTKGDEHRFFMSMFNQPVEKVEFDEEEFKKI